MSTNKTTYYQLHQWSGWDSILRTEFNENFTLLDTALAAVGNSGFRILMGNYLGNNTYPRTISIGLTPKMVMLSTGGRMYNGASIFGGLAYANGGDTEGFHIVEGGFELLESRWSGANNLERHFYTIFY